MTTAITQWVTRARTITAVGVLAGALALPAPPARAFPGTTERVSVDSAGNQANGPCLSGAFAPPPSITPDGRFVAFAAWARNLAPGDTNGFGDVFVHDRRTSITERVSVDGAGNEANDTIHQPAISADGHFVVFVSAATNLVPGDTNERDDVFVHDRLTRTTERVSVDSAGSQADGGSSSPAISADGRFVAFVSFATNLVPGDSNGRGDVFVRDRLTQTTERVSVDSAGNEANRGSDGPSISANGRFVVFWSDATNLVRGDTNGVADVFVRDRLTRTTERVSVDSAGNEGNGASGLHSHSEYSISADGRFVAFVSSATNLVPGDTNGAADVFVHDRLTRTTERVSVDSAGNQGNDGSFSPAVSANGRFVAFVSFATNLAAGDSDSSFISGVFVHDRHTGTTELVSVDSGGNRANGSSQHPSISATGGFVAFVSFATNLVPGDTNEQPDVFVRDRKTAEDSDTTWHHRRRPRRR